MRAGHSLVELVFVMGIIATISGIAVPQVLSSLDDYRTAGAARYFSTRLQRTRMEALVRSREVAVRFVQVDGVYEYSVFVDGDGDGVRTRDIRSGMDWQLGAPEKLSIPFTGVDFGVLPGLPAVDSGSAPPGTDPIKVGASDLLSFSANGTSSSGSVYIRGRRQSQYVVRVFGITAKPRVLKFSPGRRQWTPL